MNKQIKDEVYDQIFRDLHGKEKHRVWIISDLQQDDPINAERCVHIAVDDILENGFKPEQIWYLGDSVQGCDLKHLKEMAFMQEEAFIKTGAEVYYVTGNHDYDYSSQHTDIDPIIPMQETVRAHTGWHTAEKMDDICFTGKIGDHPVFFFTDHISPNNRWLTTHGQIRYGLEEYPYNMDDFRRIRNEISSAGPGVITASHYAFPGGNRASNLLSNLFPLPSNVRIHFYGHSHISDWKWGKENAFRRISGTDWHDIPQIDVASMENIRIPFCRSVLFTIYEDDTFGVYFRDHDHHRFTEAYFPSLENSQNASSENEDFKI